MNKEELLENARLAREKRAHERQQLELHAAKTSAALTIQRYIRRFLAFREARRRRLAKLGGLLQSSTSRALQPVELFELVQVYLRMAMGVATPPVALLAPRICTALIASMNEAATSYVSLALSSVHTVAWFQQVKSLLHILVSSLQHHVGTRTGADGLATVLHALIVLTDARQWKICQGPESKEVLVRRGVMTSLVANILNDLLAHDLFKTISGVLHAGIVTLSPCITSASLAAIMAFILRAFAIAKQPQEAMLMFAIHILSVPTLTSRLASMCAETYACIQRDRIVLQCLAAINSSEQSAKIVLNALDGNQAVCLLANIVFALNVTQPRDLGDQYIQLLQRLLLRCQEYVVARESNITYSHPIFGWFSVSSSRQLLDVMPMVLDQLRLLWGSGHITYLFADVAVEVPRLQSRNGKESVRGLYGNKALFVDATAASRVQRGASTVRTMLATFPSCSSEILSNVSFHPTLVPELWRFISFLGPKPNMQLFLDSALAPEKEPLIDVLILACDTLSRLIVVLDDEEIFMKQVPMQLQQLTDISTFLNKYVFKSIWATSEPPVTGAIKAIVLTSASQLLHSLYELDSRRPYVPVDHWLVKDISASSFTSKLNDEKLQSAPYRPAHTILSQIPHVLPYKTRVKLFRDDIAQERALREAQGKRQKIYITIRRSDILADGFRELARIPADALKDSIKIKFVNSLGLNEAGIDENGVFKEFLEETIKAAFNPELNLFREIPETRLLYPSSTSGVHENHLQLFEFVGRMLGKACYDGIVTEVPFAYFFLNTLLGRNNGFDELATLDPYLTKNLLSVKNYDGDVSDLELYFAVDEEQLGQLVTIPLLHGGTAKQVTNENRILYVHLMADYRLNRQMRPQCQAFVRGFRAVINADWLTMFSAREFQTLISGSTEKMDVTDLARNTEYIGGYHSGHKVIRWLWDIVAELDAKEQANFLKFVTSSSRQPVLGFGSLQPKFTIRALQEGEAEDNYTLGRAFLNLFSSGEDTDRLPTASTCFNLLKLPIYKSKKTLREKLRYAINSGAGFELS